MATLELSTAELVVLLAALEFVRLNSDLALGAVTVGVRDKAEAALKASDLAAYRGWKRGVK